MHLTPDVTPVQAKGRWTQPGSLGRPACPSCAPAGLGQAPGPRVKAECFSGTSDPDVRQDSAQGAASLRSDPKAAAAGVGGRPVSGQECAPPHPCANVLVTGSHGNRGLDSGVRVAHGVSLETGDRRGPGHCLAQGWWAGPRAGRIPAQPGYFYRA